MSVIWLIVGFTDLVPTSKIFYKLAKKRKKKPAEKKSKKKKNLAKNNKQTISDLMNNTGGEKKTPPPKTNNNNPTTTTTKPNPEGICLKVGKGAKPSGERCGAGDASSKVLLGCDGVEASAAAYNHFYTACPSRFV